MTNGILNVEAKGAIGFQGSRGLVTVNEPLNDDCAADICAKYPPSLNVGGNEEGGALLEDDEYSVQPEASVKVLSLESKAIIEAAVSKAANGDQGAPFELEVLHALLALQCANYPEWIRKRGELKQVNRGIPLTKLDRALSELKKANKDVRPTHNGYALHVLKQLSIGPYKPVFSRGALYIPCADTQLWEPLEPGTLRCKIAQLHDGDENCFRNEDYEAIAAHAMDVATDASFFESAPNGIAGLHSFFSLKGAEIQKEPLGLQHRQVHALPFEPADMPTPVYDAFMEETFYSQVPGEEEDQRRLVEEVAGAAMLGLAPRYQKAFLWIDRHGRAGKGTLQTIYENLVPSDLCAAVPPFKWHKEYYLAELAGKRLNVVGELPEDALIPAAEFKTVLGGDRVTGRMPAGYPFTFRNEAAHLFMSNHFIRTSEHSEAFYARWILIEFPNSRLKKGLPLDSSLAKRIIDAEMPGIAHKALLAAARLAQQDKYSESSVHNRLMVEWRRSSSSTDEFIHEACELGASYFVRRASLYRAYDDWCRENGRKAVSKARFKDQLQHNLAFGIRLAVLDGYEIFRGVRDTSGLKAVSDLDGDTAVSVIVQDADF